MSDPQPRPRRVLVISLGGTITMTAGATGGVVPALSADRLLASVPGLADANIDVQTLDLRRLPGASLGFDDLALVRAAVTQQVADGVVVVQGTDTIEETSFLLDLYHADSAPLVVTGAMRNPTLAGADGPANLLAAIQVAASPAAAGLGCLVVLADEIHAARRVSKTHSTAGSTFQSPDGGPLGYVVEGRPRFLNRPIFRPVIPARAGDAWPTVVVVPVLLGDDGALLEGLGPRVDGVVIAGFGVGHVPLRLLPLIDDLAHAVPVVLASRTRAGSVLADTYGFPGSERDLLGRGLIRSGFLDPYKARILLGALLAAKADHDTISAAFAAAGGHGEPGDWPWPPADRR